MRFSKDLRSLSLMVVFALASSGCTSAAPETSAIPQASSTPMTPSVEALDPGTHVVALGHEGRDRSYRVYIPESVSNPAPLIVALHGGGGNAVSFQDQNGLDAVADREGFVVVYPEGTGRVDRIHTWNAGIACCGYALDNDVDDVGFLRTVLEDVQGRVSIDPLRISVTGHSNGAAMAYRFAVEAGELVAAIVPVGGAMQVAKFEPAQQIPVLHIHSVDDPRALYDGGLGPPFPLTNRRVMHEPVMAGIEAWSAHNGCVPEPVLLEATVGVGADDGQSVDHLIWEGCAANAEVEHLRLAGSGHGWPGVKVGPVLQRLLGPSTTMINASEAVWAFASQYQTRPRS